MAYAVDDKGKVRANPSTGSVMGGSGGLFDRVAEALRSGLSGTGAAIRQTANENMGTNFQPSSQQPVPEVYVPPIVTSGGVQRPVYSTRAYTPSVSFQSPSQMDVGSELAPSTFQPDGLAASTGTRGPAPTRTVQDIGQAVSDLLPKYDAGLDAWEQMAAKGQGREARAQNVFGEDYAKDNGFGWFDNQLALEGNNAVNDAYIRGAMDKGLSYDDAYDIMHPEAQFEVQSSVPKGLSGSTSGIDVIPKQGDGKRRVTADVIDDGTVYDYNHMTADTMTGEQYLEYAGMGMGGRPVDEIVPDALYSKRRESLNYDFKPFTPDPTSFSRMVTSNALDTPARLGKWVSSLRTESPISGDYTINYNGKSYSGRDFYKKAAAYMGQFEYNDRFDADKFLTRPSNDAYTPSVIEYEIPDVNGRNTYHYGRIAVDASGNGIMPNYDVNGNYTGTYTINFTDGSSVEVTEDYVKSKMDDEGGFYIEHERVPAPQAHGQLPEDLESINNADEAKAMAEQFGGSPLDYANVLYLPDMVLSDGTRVAYDDARKIFYDQDADDDDGITYKFGNVLGIPFLTNKPTRLSNQEMFGVNEDTGRIEVNPADAFNNMVDWTLGSLPISMRGPAPWVYSLSNAKMAAQGVDPLTYDPASDSYSSLIAGNYDDDGNISFGVKDQTGNVSQRLSDEVRNNSALFNAIVPLTEMVVGPVGEHLIPLEGVTNRLFGEMGENPTVRRVILNALVDAMGEGVEEDLGNVFEELQTNGLSGAFADQAVDEEGNPMYDDTWRPIMDYTTPTSRRVQNALDPADLLNSFWGGVAVDALMQGVPTAKKVGAAARRAAVRNQTGVGQLQGPSKIDMTQWDQIAAPLLEDEDEAESYYERQQESAGQGA